jgi:hypothetical protein
MEEQGPVPGVPFLHIPFLKCAFESSEARRHEYQNRRMALAGGGRWVHMSAA